MENEIMTTQTELDEFEEENEGGSSIGKKILGGAIVAGLIGGAVLLWHKTKGRREAKKIRDLEKAGYIVIKDEETSAECKSDDASDDSEEE